MVRRVIAGSSGNHRRYIGIYVERKLMRLKRTSLVLSTLVLGLVLAACANNPTEPATASPPAGETAASPESILEVPEVGVSPEAESSPDDQVAQASPGAEASPAAEASPSPAQT